MALSLGRYRKTVVAVVGIVLGVLTQTFVGNEWIELAVALAAVLGVYAVPNVVPAAKTPTAPSLVVTPHQGG